MQSHLMQDQAQPFVRLMQSNMDLLTRFTTSPEVTAQASATASQMFQRANTSAMSIMQSAPFMNLMQGMLKNYTDFLTELSQSGFALLNQGQVAMLRQVQEAATDTVEATAGAMSGRGRARAA